LAHDIPALLVDLTNTIRHGDVCLMIGPDPHLIEVKSSKGLNTRGKRQKRALEKLHSFFETDKAKELRGVRNVRRVSFESAERTYVDELNACIAEARKNGFAVRKPEPGLAYIVMTDRGKDLVDTLNGLKPKAPWVFTLNDHKLQRDWAPYVPFTLSLEAHDDLWDFIRGDIYIIVILETNELCKIAMDYGYSAEFDATDVDHPLRVRLPEIDEQFGISSAMLARVGMEFISPQWLVQTSIDMVKHGLEAIKAKM
jgi:hypothetical protein